MWRFPDEEKTIMPTLLWVLLGVVMIAAAGAVITFITTLNSYGRSCNR